MKKKSLRWLALLLAMAFVLAGCGAKSEAAYDSAAVEGAPMAEEAPAEEWIVEDAMVEEEVAVEESAATTEAGVDAKSADSSNRKLIKRYYISLETREYEELVAYIQEAVDAAGGYIENSNMSGTSIDGYGSRYAYFTLRVPVSDANDFIKGLEENGHMTNKSEEVEDVTLAYVDTKSRIEALRIEQETLMNMLAQAETLDTILGIQSRLTEVRYQLESYESQIRSYDNLIEYTTISVDVYEVERETVIDDGTFWTRLKDRVSDSLYDFGQGAENLIIWFIAAFPYWVTLAVIGGVIALCVRASHRRYWKKKELEKTLKSQTLDADSKEKEQ